MDVHHVLQYDVFMRLDMEKLNARAKINIGLAVGKRRCDGYHPIRSYFARISLHDTINIDIRPANKFSCKIKSNVPYLEANNVDIMEKCARAFCEGSGHLFDLYIEIEKRIPTRSGFGGGSSDGAEILKALNKYYDCPLDYPSLIDLGAKCGSDIPFFLSDASFAYVEGRGDVLHTMDIPDGLGSVLLFMPDEEISTASAYNKLDELDYDFISLPKKVECPIDKADFPNDFERVISSNLQKTLFDLYSDISFVSLSGSGSGCYVIASGSNIEQIRNLAPTCYIEAQFV